MFFRVNRLSLQQHYLNSGSYPPGIDVDVFGPKTILLGGCNEEISAYLETLEIHHLVGQMCVLVKIRPPLFSAIKTTI